MTLALLRSKVAWLGLLLGTCVIASGCGGGEPASEPGDLSTAPSSAVVYDGETLTVGAGRSSFLMVTGDAESAHVSAFAVTSQGLDLGKGNPLGRGDTSDPKIRLLELADASWLIGQRICTKVSDDSGCGGRSTRFAVFDPSAGALRDLGTFPELDEYQLLHEPTSGHVLLVAVADVRGVPEWKYFDLDIELGDLSPLDVDIPALSRSDALGTTGCQTPHAFVVLTRSDTRPTITLMQGSVTEDGLEVEGTPVYVYCSPANDPLLLTVDNAFVRTYRLHAVDGPWLDSELRLPGPLLNLNYAPGTVTAVIGSLVGGEVKAGGVPVIAENRSLFVYLEGTWSEAPVPPGVQGQMIAAGDGQSFAAFSRDSVRAWVR